MKHIVSTVFLCTLFTLSYAQLKKSKAIVTPKSNVPVVIPTNISLTLKPYKKTWVYIGSYYGKGKTLVDSVFLDDDSKGVFRPSKKYTSGIYFVVSPKMAILFEFLMDDKQHFSIEADTAKREEPTITGSPDNDLFKAYSQFQ